MASERKSYVVDKAPGFPAEIGGWIWALNDVRRHTRETVRGLAPAVIDWPGPAGHENSIGTLLYHVAIVEMDWLFFDILESEFPPAVAALFAFPMRAGQRLTPMSGVPLEAHLDRLDQSRWVFLDELGSLSADDWSRPRSPAGADYTVTPEWVVYHLVEHEARHSDQMRSLIGRAGK